LKSPALASGIGGSALMKINDNLRQTTPMLMLDANAGGI
jgi:hypothetical protein